MDGVPPDVTYGLRGDVLTRLMPMAAVVSPSGHIRVAGPTLSRLHAGVPLTGARFLEVFGLIRPGPVSSMAALAALAGRRLLFQMRNPAATPLRGHVLPLEPASLAGGGLAAGGLAAGGLAEGGLIVNLSFGISAPGAVRDHALTHADFAPTDLTVELLYLSEAKAAVTEEMKALNRRLHEAHQDAAQRALTDPLTGLGNRRAFDEALLRTIAAARRGVPFALLHLDLDHFKAVNDTLGHGAGDQVITAVAGMLKSETRAGDVAARVGGDEFAVILAGQRTAPAIAGLCTRIIRHIERPIPCSEGTARISASIGVCLSPEGFELAPAALIAISDAALYESKRNGRGRCTIRPALRDQPDPDRETPPQG